MKPRRKKPAAKASKAKRRTGPKAERAADPEPAPAQLVPVCSAVEPRARVLADAALARLERLETLEPAYDAWLELKLEHAAFLARMAGEAQKLEQQGAFLVGAVRTAAELGGTAPESAEAALAKRDANDPLRSYLADAEEKIRTARARLDAELASESAIFDAALEQLRSEIERRVQRMLAGAPPRLHLLLRPIGATRTVLHAERVGPDASVLLLYALTGRIPSRHGFLFDDSTDDVALPPPPLYPEEGVPAAQTRPSPEELCARVREAGRVLPVKGFVPLFVPRPAGGEDFFRFLQRGPVMEAELLDAGAFRSVLAREEGERLAGYLLRLKLEGRIDLELGAG